MIILLHGGGALGISQKISQIKKDFDTLSVVEISGKNSSFANARSEYLTPQLFSEKRLVILEDFSDLEFELLEDREDLTLVLKFSKLLPSNSKILKEALSKKIQILLFEEAGETPIFPFLDKLGEKNPKALEEFERNHDEWGGQYIFSMMFYLLRRMLISSKKAPAFIVQRLERQKRNFSILEIKNLYKFMLENDFKIKSGLIDEKLALTLVVNKFLN
ncbi:MAG: hypothetical protein ACD_30C00050G0006 [uncultured bacterium]|uniref:Uncharacterized protein n=3 Tax=Candidatus Daviesiibacteriota TaxID=1752718 RepID=A0A0G0EM16_9BACT|nr:MAG: hypothetical protein ACD_30C00050G0006 [uncultured bacterium]KKQ08073.1 MAG: hypothetical protein US19_C0032G0017 [Candidatus Daviesbacteria bacterium GW2011_GWB1_36_5]KKQ16247.1 MAG: hypothetical protein US28_C0003G0011 [Candidatus Daviesbacteria bacterium GW2011_GWA1_36_8]OGE33115.1 MAG: hypothetical protein A3C99_03760 [Candidatus Daviesbacteria bacterium RIFCSPHIGHO2_02_FULL_37_9]OGE36713.1 MAG: hypothetical protein A3E66_02160 [Candidatus Daviesbacteria bacterium RIFCSPHIGHO2_12_FU